MSRRSMFYPAAVLAMAASVAACDVTEPNLSVSDVTLEAVGDFLQLEAVGAEGELPHWQSLDTTIVTVTPAGLAVAKGPGTALVRARLGSRTAEASVTVLPPIDIQLSNLAVVTDPGDNVGLFIKVKNVGGRGFYRIEYWRHRAEGETSHTRISANWNDQQAGPGMEYGTTDFALPAIADWVVAYSREPLSTVYVLTSCVRLDGGQPCPME